MKNSQIKGENVCFDFMRWLMHSIVLIFNSMIKFLVIHVLNLCFKFSFNLNLEAKSEIFQGKVLKLAII
jgi:hypothetical protein